MLEGTANMADGNGKGESSLGMWRRERGVSRWKNNKRREEMGRRHLNTEDVVKGNTPFISLTSNGGELLGGHETRKQVSGERKRDGDSDFHCRRDRFSRRKDGSPLRLSCNQEKRHKERKKLKLTSGYGPAEKETKQKSPSKENLWGP